MRGVGLPSGVEYVALGFVLGPHALDLVGGDNLAAFEPVVQVALGWLAFVDRARLRLRGRAGACASAAWCSAASARS